jgi:tripartite-type tricarboxylate transporter receptor subunit TctC
MEEDVMTMKRRQVLGSAAALAGAALLPSAARAAWPDKPITWINPFPAGGGTDVFARPLAAKLTEALHQQVLIDNKGGAGGTVGAAQAAKAKPDGHTFFVGAIHHTIAPSIYKSLEYDLEKDFVPITMVALVPQVVSIHPQRVPASSLKGFIDYARANPGKINYASPGTGTAHHLAGELFQIQTKIKLTHVPFRGAGPAMQDLLAGQVDMMFDGMGTSAQPIRTGRLKGLAVATRERVKAFPEIPTALELGVPGWEVSTWYGLWAIKGTPEPVIDRMHAEIGKALQHPDVVKIWAEQSAQAGGESRADFARRIRGEIEKWAKVCQEAGVKLE